MANIHIVALSGTQLTETPVGIDDVTGQITVPTLMPVNQDHLTTKEYVDQSVASFITQSALNTAVAALAPQTEIVRIDSELALKADATDLADLSADVLHLIGGVMSGPIIYANAPQADDELVNKAYVDGAIASGSGSGGTALPPDAVGYLYNDGNGTLDWGTPAGGGGGGTALPADAVGALTNDGVGNLTWAAYLTQTDADARYAPIGGGGAALPADAAGMLVNDGSGGLSWGPTIHIVNAAPVDADGEDGDVFFVVP